jgi:MoxR-like ATPase
MDDVKIAWRKWLGMRVKIIDEYNRIPTRTQSALLTVMADDYAELYDQIYECPPGGVVPHRQRRRRRRHLPGDRGAARSHRRGGQGAALQHPVLRRAARAGRVGVRPEELVPPEIVFTGPELDRMEREIRAIHLPAPLLRRMEFFASAVRVLRAGGAHHRVP